MAEGDDVVIETQLSISGLETLGVGGMPTGDNAIFSDESILFRVTVANTGLADAGDVDVALSIDGQHKHTYVIPHIAPTGGEATGEWATDHPLAVGQHGCRIGLARWSRR
jgi:hypothetical protein